MHAPPGGYTIKTDCTADLSKIALKKLVISRMLLKKALHINFKLKWILLNWLILTSSNVAVQLLIIYNKYNYKQ